MRIDPGSEIAGLPAIQVRDLLRSLRDDYFGKDVLVARVKGVSPKKANSVFLSLVDLGYIDQTDPPDKWESYYVSTLGNALANGSAAKPVLRETAQRHLDDFLNRVEKVNSDPYWIYCISEVRLFGSMLLDTPKVNDVDLAFDVIVKGTHEPEFRQRLAERIDKAIKSGRTFRNLSDQISWPATEVYLYLKARSRVLSFCELTEPEMLGVKYKTIYKQTG